MLNVLPELNNPDNFFYLALIIETEFSFRRELDLAAFERKNRVIFRKTGVLPGQNLRPALADDDVSNTGYFAVMKLDAEKLRVRIS